MIKNLYPYAKLIQEKCLSLHRKDENGFMLVDCEKCEFHYMNEQEEPECVFDNKSGYPASVDDWRL